MRLYIQILDILFFHSVYYTTSCFWDKYFFYGCYSFCNVNLLFITITPTITIAEIGVRGSVAIFVLGLFSSNDIAILSSTTILWLINLIIPAIIGSFFIFSLKFLDQNDDFLQGIIFHISNYGFFYF